MFMGQAPTMEPSSPTMQRYFVKTPRDAHSSSLHTLKQALAQSWSHQAWSMEAFYTSLRYEITWYYHFNPAPSQTPFNSHDSKSQLFLLFFLFCWLKKKKSHLILSVLEWILNNYIVVSLSVSLTLTELSQSGKVGAFGHIIRISLSDSHWSCAKLWKWSFTFNLWQSAGSSCVVVTCRCFTKGSNSNKQRSL